MKLLKSHNFFQQTYQLTLAALIVRYRRTSLGLAWVILNPIFVLIVQSLVFSRVLNIKIDHYVLYLVAGLLPWLFISQTLEMGTAQLKSNSLTIKAFFIKPYLLTTSLVFENIINLFITMLFTLLPLCFYYNKSPYLLMFWVLNIIPLSVALFSLAFVFSALNILFKDLRYLVTFSLSLLYFITPIFYTPDLIPTNLHWLIDYNPVYILISPFQLIALDFNFNIWVRLFSGAMVLSLIFLFFSYFLWKKIRNSFYLNL